MVLIPKYCQMSLRILQRYCENGCQRREVGQHVGEPPGTVGQLQHFTVIVVAKYLLWSLSKLSKIRKISFLVDIVMLHGQLLVSLNLRLFTFTIGALLDIILQHCHMVLSTEVLII